MQDLPQSVYQYYRANFETMPLDKQFHFASRLFLWSRDEFAARQLPKLRPEFTANNGPAEALQKIIDEAKNSPAHGSKNAAELRRPYFEKYPELKTETLLLFRVAHLLQIYHLDARDDLLSLVPASRFEATISSLLDDHETLAILSTHAINLLYLYSRIVSEDDRMFDPNLFLEVGHTMYDPTNPVHIQLLIYLYTHCIIGETKFYYRTIPPLYKPVYLQMLAELETLIGARFGEINLDNKFEYLVCCRLLGVTSPHEKAIFAEAAQSISPDGDFLVDRHNTNPQSSNITLAASEHRNVLFLMANRTFTPTATA